jgi:hypothetical protein
LEGLASMAWHGMPGSAWARKAGPQV